MLARQTTIYLKVSPLYLPLSPSLTYYLSDLPFHISHKLASSGLRDKALVLKYSRDPSIKSMTGDNKTHDTLFHTFIPIATNMTV